MDSPSHWHTVSDVTEEIYTVENLAPSSTVVFVVRARNHHGLSPPSPISKPMNTEGGTGLEPSLNAVRIQLAARVVELREAIVVGSRKVKLQWEVSGIISSPLTYKSTGLGVELLNSRACSKGPLRVISYYHSLYFSRKKVESERKYSKYFR